MEHIKFSEVTPERLASLKKPVMIVEDEGNHIGLFRPQPEPADWEKCLDELSPEEWERREKAGGRPLNEYLQEVDSK